MQENKRQTRTVQEELARERGLDFAKLSLDEKNSLWAEVKRDSSQ